MTSHQAEPIEVRVVNHPEPRKYQLRAAYNTIVLTTANPYQQVCGADPLRERVRFSPAAKNYVIGSSVSQASDPNNASGVATAKPNGRLVPSTGTVESIAEGQQEIWVAGATADLPISIGYEIIRKVPD